MPPAVNDIPRTALAEFCRKWGVTELALFGSILREDFRTDSDVDVLVELRHDHGLGWEIFDMQAELEAMFGRRVDLVFKDALRNPIRRRAILQTRKVLYAA